MTRYIFHLSVPVGDLEVAKAFYLDVLGAKLLRSFPDFWVNELFLRV